MKLFKVDIWIKDSNFKTYLVVADCEKIAMRKAISRYGEVTLIGVTVKPIESIEGYKICINKE
ncbi:hypothetical protein [Clostridium botulinum]|uniref:hypothetical protein n=1 Tax=Clostridium botulinum TaxID=1491 RepID=UPI0013FE69E8|nr:hypothetical protein [Clostridium botulinum]MBY6915395.1 hypothetical protein [Clostridium botulinum]NFQ37710.1 hypothetical protein [Clostridium botulinum]